jgi:drug/metabolite transporter (DMT)-like permease
VLLSNPDRARAGAYTIIPKLTHRKGITEVVRDRSVRAPIALFGYAIAFSFAYLSLSAGTGALILFAGVQITMLGYSIASGQRPRLSEWIGLLLAFGGFVYLVFPGLSAPSPVGVSLMALAGVGWGYYSVAAKGVRSPITTTAANFAKAAPLAAGTLLVVLGIGRYDANWSGLALAATSGALTSGLGYAIWYRVLEDLGTTRGAIVQLTVPVIAAAAGVVFLGEQLTWRLGLASAAILGGVGLALLGKQ